MPERLFTAIKGKELVARDLPFASEPFDWQLYWHRRHDGNRAVLWLRGMIAETCHSLG
jgi:DNA-binding transcriptional LysR family regulator